MGESELEARQFSDEPLINYGIWGFIAGLSDYFIRSALTMPTTTTTTTTTATTAATTTSMRRRNKNKTKKNKNKRNKTKGKKADRIVEVLEAEPIPDVEPLKIDEDNMKSEDMAPETVEQETVEA